MSCSLFAPNLFHFKDLNGNIHTIKLEVSGYNYFITYKKKYLVTEIISEHNFNNFILTKSEKFFKIYCNSKLIIKKINERKFDKLFIFGIITFNRLEYFKECINTFFKYLSNDIDYIIIIADGNSNDSKQNYIENLQIPNNTSLYFIINYEHFIYNQTNSILTF